MKIYPAPPARSLPGSSPHARNISPGVGHAGQATLRGFFSLGVGSLLAYSVLVIGAFSARYFSYDHSIPTPGFSYEIFSLPPPPKAEELSSLYQYKSIFSPDYEVTLEVGGDMILAHVNKTNALPPSYIPPELIEIRSLATEGKEYLRSAILIKLELLFSEAKTAGISFLIRSGYRSYEDQEDTFSYWVKEVGYDNAVLVSARPGHSEHQLGTTVDLSLGGSWDFSKSSPAWDWLNANAHRFGFVISYPKGKEAITGYVYEPWHIRYVGEVIARTVFEQGITLEEYLSHW